MQSFLRSPPGARAVMGSGADTVVAAFGTDGLADAARGLLHGENVRLVTEQVTRATLAQLANHTRQALFIPGLGPESVVDGAVAAVIGRSVRGLDLRWCYWLLGLTDKQVQNVLRDSPEALHDYAAKFLEVIDDEAKEMGGLRVQVGGGAVADARQFLYFTQVVGAQTLTIRGSHKSTFGKFFERLVLAAFLEVLGLTRDETRSGRLHTYWLHDDDDGASGREADAVAVIAPGQLLHIDIGFIGRGNPEIILDKLTRYARQRDLGKVRFNVQTLVLADRFGQASTIAGRAEVLGALCAEMANPNWVQSIAVALTRQHGARALPESLAAAAADRTTDVTYAVSPELISRIVAAGA